jgi:hypothetical protein
MKTSLKWSKSPGIAASISWGKKMVRTQQRIELKRCAIVMDADQPPYVSKITNDLKDCLEQTHHAHVSIASSLEKGAGAVIAVGKQIARQIAGPSLSLDDLGQEGFIISRREHEGRPVIVVTGNSHPGTKFGVARLLQMIQSDGAKASFIDLPADASTTGGPASGGKSIPCFEKRGIHPNGWTHNYPYAFHSWREADWQKFIDLQTLQGVNLLMMFSYMETMPVPLSSEDQGYLEEMRRVVEYAQVLNGMEVWLMQAVNRVAKDNCGVLDPWYRPLWRPSQVDLNPGDPEQFKELAASHEVMYKIVNNVDGICFIDSDPGGWVDSPPEDLLKVFQHTRDCLDRYNLKGKNAKIIHWLWTGWGYRGWEDIERTQAEMRDALRIMKAHLAEPWEIICGRAVFLSLCQEESVLSKTIFLPYNTIEVEPSYPHTDLRFSGIRAAFAETAKFQELEGIMANVQAPLLQFPNLYYWHKLAWDPQAQAVNAEDMLMELAELLYPGRKELIPACFKAVRGSSPETIDELGDRLEALSKKKDKIQAGCFGKKLFPDTGILIKILLFQIKFVSARGKFFSMSARPFDRHELQNAMQDFFAAYLDWDLAHGWHDLWGYYQDVSSPDWKQWALGGLRLKPPFDPPFAAVLKYIHQHLGSGTELDKMFIEITKAMAGKYGSLRVVHACIEPMRRALKNSTEEKTS